MRHQSPQRLPDATFKLKDGCNTCKVRVSAFSQPSWVEGTRIDSKDILETLTSVSLSVSATTAGQSPAP
jgi:hypothetical protein